ncbi:MAG: CDP-diacylglycerol--serine O-phosphatidyltransferase [Chryseotalea sp. WA131a]|nr:MAG: CDP-diacylglycerol--serine O-phosphatidyltransferase [Chryseotalea sp. WA131a]
MIRKSIPNFLTSCNLFCGCLGIVACLEGWSTPAAYFVWAAATFDFFDGFAARWLKVSSPIGKELDSLADVISFGLLPAMVMYKMIGATTSHTWLPYVAFMIAVFSALRLAIFNVDETQSDSFKGLNTPANTLFVTSLPLIAFQVGPWLFQEEVLVAITLVFSFLLVSPLRFFAFKFKNFSWADNWLRFTFIGISVLLLVLFQVSAIPLIILLYIVSSLVDSAIGWKL